MSERLTITEIYLSLQGESSWAGWPCIFIRLTGCNLRCSYCDTAYAFSGGRRYAVDEVMGEVGALGERFGEGRGRERLPLVEVTGGEPLLQAGALPLMKRLCDTGYTVLLETSGALDVAPVDPRVRKIMDLKAPSSGERERNRWENLAILGETDEVKFVLGTEEDYKWMRRVLEEHRLAERCSVLVSWAAPLASAQRHVSLKPSLEGVRLTCRELAERVIADALPVRFQVQMHKVLWSPEARGV